MSINTVRNTNNFHDNNYQMLINIQRLYHLKKVEELLQPAFSHICSIGIPDKNAPDDDAPLVDPGENIETSIFASLIAAFTQWETVSRETALKGLRVVTNNCLASPLRSAVRDKYSSM